MRLLLLAAVATPLIAVFATQDPAATDWNADVERACTASRLGLRIAAAKKVAAAGGAAVPALRAFAQKQGRNTIPGSLVDAIADANTNDDAIVGLLREWAGDLDFYYRASALRGLALRAPNLPAQRGALLPLFQEHHADPAWLMRTFARFGSLRLGDDHGVSLPEDDPRARVRLAALRMVHGLTPDVQPLLDALADERQFLGDPWGNRLGDEANKALKTWLGDAHPLAKGGSFEGDRERAITALHAACTAKLGKPLTLPKRVPALDLAVAGGFELLSCKHGDQFVQWTEDGGLRFGIDAAIAVQVPAAKWDALWQGRTPLQLDKDAGVVVCDSLRVRWLQPDRHVKVAPASLPIAAADWLKQLAAVIEEAGEPRLAARLRSGLDQFAAR